MLISAYSTRYEPCPHSFTAADERVRWYEAGGSDAALVDHLDALANYVRSTSGADWTVTTHALLRHIADTQRWYSFELDASDQTQLAELSRWAGEANAILVVDGAVLDGLGRPLLPGSHGQASGEVPVLAEALTRAAEIRSWLAEQRQVPVPATLAPVRSGAEVQMQDVEQVGLRVIALVLTSDFASSLLAGQPIDPAAMQAAFPRGFAALSPDERDLFDRRDPAVAGKLQLRMEAAQELLWTLNRVVNFGWPSGPCVPDQVKQTVLAGGEQGFLTGLTLRAVPELLNEYECLASLVWALDEQQHLQADPIPETDPQISAQRLSALSWLMNRGLAWDDADQRDRAVWDQ